MRIRDFRADDTPEINLIPLIDVVLCLIVFFVVTTTFDSRSVLKLQLPRAQGEPAYVEEVTEPVEGDNEPAMSGIAGASDGEKGLFDQAVAVVAREGKASTSFIQRHLNIGYNRAAKLIEQMEKEGIGGPANHVGKREVLVRRTHDED